MYCISIFFVGGLSIQDIAWRKIKTQGRRIHLLLCGTLPPDISLLGNGKLETLALWQRHPRLNTLTNDENVRNTKPTKSGTLLKAAGPCKLTE